MLKDLTKPHVITAYFTGRDRAHHPMVTSVFTPRAGWTPEPISKGADLATDSRITAARCRAMARRGITAVQVMGWHADGRTVLADFQLTELV
jgi:hypothetical protein